MLVTNFASRRWNCRISSSSQPGSVSRIRAHGVVDDALPDRPTRGRQRDEDAALVIRIRGACRQAEIRQATRDLAEVGAAGLKSRGEVGGSQRTPATSADSPPGRPGRHRRGTRPRPSPCGAHAHCRPTGKAPAEKPAGQALRCEDRREVDRPGVDEFTDRRPRHDLSSPVVPFTLPERAETLRTRTRPSTYHGRDRSLVKVSARVRGNASVRPSRSSADGLRRARRTGAWRGASRT